MLSFVSMVFGIELQLLSTMPLMPDSRGKNQSFASGSPHTLSRFERPVSSLRALQVVGFIILGLCACPPSWNRTSPELSIGPSLSPAQCFGAFE